jgi:hypothetical protein
MQFKLPVGGYRELSSDEVENFNPLNIDEHGSHGYLIYCDLHFPKGIHDKISDLPPCPKINISEDKNQICKRNFST